MRLEDMRHWLSPRNLEKLSRMQERLQGREGFKTQSHMLRNLWKQKSIRRRFTQKRRQVKIPTGGQGRGGRLNPTDLHLLLTSNQLQRAREEEERLRREARQGGQKAPLRLCSIHRQKVMRKQEGKCISSKAACRFEGLLYPNEVGHQRNNQRYFTDA